jgi:hypothetical protein
VEAQVASPAHDPDQRVQLPHQRSCLGAVRVLMGENDKVFSRRETADYMDTTASGNSKRAAQVIGGFNEMPRSEIAARNARLLEDLDGRAGGTIARDLRKSR